MSDDPRTQGYVAVRDVLLGTLRYGCQYVTPERIRQAQALTRILDIPLKNNIFRGNLIHPMLAEPLAIALLFRNCRTSIIYQWAYKRGITGEVEVLSVLRKMFNGGLEGLLHNIQKISDHPLSRIDGAEGLAAILLLTLCPVWAADLDDTTDDVVRAVCQRIQKRQIMGDPFYKAWSIIYRRSEDAVSQECKNALRKNDPEAIAQATIELAIYRRVRGIVDALANGDIRATTVHVLFGLAGGRLPVKPKIELAPAPLRFKRLERGDESSKPPIFTVEEEARLAFLYELADMAGGDIQYAEIQVRGKAVRFFAAVITHADGSESIVADHPDSSDTSSPRQHAIFVLCVGMSTCRWEDVFSQKRKSDIVNLGAFRVRRHGDWQARVIDLLTTPLPELHKAHNTLSLRREAYHASL